MKNNSFFSVVCFSFVSTVIGCLLWVTVDDGAAGEFICGMKICSSPSHYFINSACLYICFFFVFSFCIYICAQIYPILIIFLNGVNSSLIFCSCKEPSLLIEKSVNNNNKLYSWPFKKSVCSKLLIFDPPRPCLFVFAYPSQKPSPCTSL